MTRQPPTELDISRREFNKGERMELVLGSSILKNIDESSSREWIETNGLGGYASSSLSGAHTRRYHGLLVAAIHPPTDRVVLVSRLDETINVGTEQWELGCNFYPGTVHPRGVDSLEHFAQDPFPRFIYRCGDVVLQKTITMIHGENTVVVSYELLDAPGPITLKVRPIVAGRGYHSLNRANSYLRWAYRWEEERLEVSPYGDLSCVIDAPESSFTAEQYWIYNIEYPIERQRGFDCHEDLFCYGTIHKILTPGARWAVVLSSDRPPQRDGAKLVDVERQRRAKLGSGLPTQESIAPLLARAADQFLVRRGNDLATIIAGYHWFTDWGRDTMIALPGLCLVTKRFAEARSILRVFAEHCSEGLIPNRFPDNPAEKPEYNTVDATLWFFVAAYRYLEYSGDETFVRETVWPVLQDIIRWHEEGTRFDIGVDRDGLLRAGNPAVQLTWMDAKIGDWVVTPRTGKAVEVNALWCNALRIAAEFAERWDERDRHSDLLQKAERARQSFIETFWNETANCLFDYIDDEHRDSAVRPNQVIALALPFPLLDDDRARSVLRIVEERLYTPLGLRTLDPADPNFQPRYHGSPAARDSAYHQGTAWSWLLGPFISALVRYRGEAGRRRAREIVELFSPHLLEGGIGTVSEIFDGEAPHTPRGCIAQAWGVAEILRAFVEDALGHSPGKSKPSRARSSAWSRLFKRQEQQSIQ